MTTNRSAVVIFLSSSRISPWVIFLSFFVWRATQKADTAWSQIYSNHFGILVKSEQGPPFCRLTTRQRVAHNHPHEQQAVADGSNRNSQAGGDHVHRHGRL